MPAPSVRAQGAGTVCSMTCPACGVAAPDGARFCPECGQRLVAAPDERRLVSVLMGDLVGFTSMAETADPEQVKNIVDRCFERLVGDVTAFGGRLDKIVGDQIIAQWGAPIAHEDDAERAVRAALRMRDTLSALTKETGGAVQMRIGVNTGEVLVGALRAGGDPTVMGDVVNTASRLQTVAQPGQVLVGFTTYAATRGAIGYEALGALTVKGREEPVEAFAALVATSPPGHRATGKTALVGRDEEMAALRNVVDGAARRGRAHLVLLYGDAGVGKSRLAAELSAYARAQYGARILAGPCVPYGDSNVFAPLAEALRHACGLDGNANGTGGRVRVTDAVVRTLALPVESPETERLVDGLLYVMEGVARRDVDPGRARDDAMRAAITFLEGCAEEAPIVLTLSDLHWAADPVLEFVDRLLARLRGHPLVVVGTARPGFEARWSPAPGRHNVLVTNLDPLDAGATRELIDALFCGGVTDEMAAFLLERSGGNPFFVEELAALVRDSSEQGGALPDLDNDALHSLPATLHGLIAARLDALDQSERSLLEDCAIVGGTGAITSALALVANDEGEALLGRLAERDLIVLENDEFRFKSEVIRDVAYRRLTKAERARRHAALAPILATQGDIATENVANHLATAADLVQELGSVPGVAPDIVEQAIEALTVAAARAEDVESWLASGRFHERLLQLIPDVPSPRRWNALLGRARSCAHQRELDRARDDAMLVLEEAQELGDDETEAAALTVLGDVYVNAGEYDAAEATYAEAAQKWRGLGRTSGVANALRGLGFANLFRGELDEADRLIREALASFRSSNDSRGEAWALQNLAWISFSRGATGDAEARLHQSADMFAELGDWGGLGWALGLLAYVRFIQGRLDEAAELAQQIVVEGRETGNRWAVGMMNVLLANVALWTGHAAECVERGTEALELFRAMNDRWGEVQAAAPVARALGMLGRFDEYLQLLADLDAAAHTVADKGFQRIGPTVAAAVAAQMGDATRALDNIEGLVDSITLTETGNSDRAIAFAAALIQNGRVDEALAFLEPGFALAVDSGHARRSAASWRSRSPRPGAPTTRAASPPMSPGCGAGPTPTRCGGCGAKVSACSSRATPKPGSRRSTPPTRSPPRPIPGSIRPSPRWLVPWPSRRAAIPMPRRPGSTPIPGCTPSGSAATAGHGCSRSRPVPSPRRRNPYARHNRSPSRSTVLDRDQSKAMLHELRALQRKRRVEEVDWIDALYRAYMVLVFGIVAVVLLSAIVGDTHVSHHTVVQVERNAVGFVSVGLAFVLAMALRSGSRGGPHALQPAEVHHLLLAPLERDVVLRAPAIRQLRVVALSSIALGAIAGNLAFRRLPGGALSWILYGAAFGACAGLSTWGVAALASGYRITKARANLIGAGLVAWAGLDLALHVTTSPTSWIASIATLAVRTRYVAVAGPIVAIALAVAGFAAIGGVSIEAALRRSGLVGQLRFAATVQDLRVVILLHRQLASELPRRKPWVRHRARGSRAAVWRRDWSAMMRWPGSRIVRVLTLSAIAIAASIGAWLGTTPLIVVAGIATFVAALDVSEGLAQEVDHPTLVDARPVSTGWLYALASRGAGRPARVGRRDPAGRVGVRWALVDHRRRRPRDRGDGDRRNDRGRVVEHRARPAAARVAVLDDLSGDDGHVADRPPGDRAGPRHRRFPPPRARRARATQREPRVRGGQCDDRPHTRRVGHGDRLHRISRCKEVLSEYCSRARARRARAHQELRRCRRAERLQREYRRRRARHARRAQRFREVDAARHRVGNPRTDGRQGERRRFCARLHARPRRGVVHPRQSRALRRPQRVGTRRVRRRAARHCRVGGARPRTPRTARIVGARRRPAGAFQSRPAPEDDARDRSDPALRDPARRRTVRRSRPGRSGRDRGVDARSGRSRCNRRRVDPPANAARARDALHRAARRRDGVRRPGRQQGSCATPQRRPRRYRPPHRITRRVVMVVRFVHPYGRTNLTTWRVR